MNWILRLVATKFKFVQYFILFVLTKNKSLYSLYNFLKYKLYTIFIA